MIALLLTLLTAHAGTCPPAGPLEAEIAALEQALASTQLQADVLRAQRIEAEGEAIPWPEDTPADYREAAVAAHLSDLIEDSPMDAYLTSMDCSEWPCIAWLHGPAEEGIRPDGSRDDGIRWVARQLTERYPHAHRAHEGFSLPRGDEPMYVSAFVYVPDRAVTRAELERITHRLDALQAASAEASSAVVEEIFSHSDATPR